MVWGGVLAHVRTLKTKHHYDHHTDPWKISLSSFGATPRGWCRTKGAQEGQRGFRVGGGGCNCVFWWFVSTSARAI